MAGAAAGPAAPEAPIPSGSRRLRHCLLGPRVGVGGFRCRRDRGNRIGAQPGSRRCRFPSVGGPWRSRTCLLKAWLLKAWRLKAWRLQAWRLKAWSSRACYLRSWRFRSWTPRLSPARPWRVLPWRYRPCRRRCCQRPSSQSRSCSVGLLRVSLRRFFAGLALLAQPLLGSRFAAIGTTVDRGVGRDLAFAAGFAASGASPGRAGRLALRP